MVVKMFSVVVTHVVMKHGVCGCDMCCDVCCADQQGEVKSKAKSDSKSPAKHHRVRGTHSFIFLVQSHLVHVFGF